MTEPDPVAALAAQLDQLRGELSRYEGEVGQLRARLTKDSGQVVMLRLEIKQLGEKLEAEIAKFGTEAQREARAETEAEIREELKRLPRKLDEAIAKRAAADLPAPYWLGLSREEHAARLAEVRAWVDRVALVQYPTFFGKLPPCWASHADLVIELSNLMTEWTRVYGDPASRPFQDALWFHERWLPGVLSRCEKWFKCDVSGCRLARTSPWERSPPRYT